MVTDALKPCPFCGGKAARVTLDEPGDNFGGDVITCTRCGASSHVEFGRKENLVSRWNTRPALDTTLEETEQVTRAEYSCPLGDACGLASTHTNKDGQRCCDWCHRPLDDDSRHTEPAMSDTERREAAEARGWFFSGIGEMSDDWPWAEKVSRSGRIIQSLGRGTLPALLEAIEAIEQENER